MSLAEATTKPASLHQLSMLDVRWCCRNLYCYSFTVGCIPSLLLVIGQTSVSRYFYVARSLFGCSPFCVCSSPMPFVSHSPFLERCVPCLLVLRMSHMCDVSFTMCQITLRPSTIMCFHTLTASLSQHMGMDCAAA